MSLVEKVEATKLIKNNDRIVIGVSGGPDSVCLFDILVKLRDKYNLKLFVVHINHSIRKEADIEQEYVNNQISHLSALHNYNLALAKRDKLLGETHGEIK